VQSLLSSYIIPEYVRVEGHITTDKVVYRPNDVIFIEVLIIDAFKKTPVALNALDNYFNNNYITMDVYDPTDSKVYTTFTQVQNSTVSFTYKVPT